VANARTVVQTLQQVVQRGTGTAAAVPKWQVAGKTGSTDNNIDAWFVGVTPKLATAVWMGDPADNEHSMYNVGVFPKVFGGTYPAMIFSAYMKQFLAGQAVIDFAPPDRVPNQRAPKFLNLEGELTQTGGVRNSQNTADLNQQARNPTTNNNNTGNNNNNVPAPTVPRAPVATVPDPVVPQVPVVTIPTFPDITVPRVVIPPVVEDTTPTTRRNRG
jgi:membrane peptidoglycan carboxypeptidase